ncbi:MAG: phage major capsid protein [bacterium]
MSDTLAMPALTELDEKIEAKNKVLAGIFDEAGPDIDLRQVKSIPGDTKAKAEEIRKLNDELTDLGRQRDELTAVRKAAERVRTAPGPGGKVDAGGEPGSEPGAPAVQAPPTKSFGQLFVESQAYKARTGGVGPESKLDIELKTLFETSAGWAPESTRTGRVVDFATRPVQVTDILPQTTTTQAAVVYMEETTFTNAAAETAEGGTYPEATLELTEKSSTVRKIPVFIPVTDEQLEDEPQVRGYIDNRLPFMLRQRLDGQILTGDGVAPNLEGILNVTGIQTQAKGTDPTPDAVYKAMTKVRVTGRAMSNAAVFHPNDWQDIRLLRTADGIYIWGNPSDAGPERIWGLQVTQSDAITENTAVVGDFANFSELAVRRGIDVQVSNSHSTFFVEGKQAMRADIRVAILWYRPAAFCTVTGI